MKDTRVQNTVERFHPTPQSEQKNSCSQSLSHLLCQICVHPLVFSWRKNSWPTSTCFEGGKQDFSSSKGDVAGILSELDIDELVLLVFGGWMLGMVTCYCRIVRVEAVLRSHLDFLGFSLSWNSGLSHRWIHVVSKAFLSRTS